MWSSKYWKFSGEQNFDILKDFAKSMNKKILETLISLIH